MRRGLSAALVLLALGACATERGPRGRLAPAGPVGPRLFVSPAGEPFRPTRGGPAPIEAWFAGADADRDGVLTRPEFSADFARAFAAFDSDGDGEIEPTEVARYELEILPEMRGGGPAMRGGGGARRSAMGGMQRDRAMRRGGRPIGATMMMAGAARFGLLPISHPIMDADVNFNGGVSREEFAGAAMRRFGLLDPTGSGRLSLADLRAQRMDRGRRRGRRPA
ncbi:MAG: EF-hand domain-containing protein [Sphingomonas sp.]